LHDRKRPHTHDRFDTLQRPDGSVYVDIYTPDVNGLPHPPFTVARPSDGWSVAACLDAATAFATEMHGPAHTKDHRIVARFAFLAMLDATNLRKAELMQSMTGVDLWEDRYPHR
jgi:hypothetical protein